MSEESRAAHRFLVDENLPGQIAARLREAGYQDEILRRLAAMADEQLADTVATIEMGRIRLRR